MAEWHHSPSHKLLENGAYIITAGTYQKEHILNSPEKLDCFQEKLFQLAGESEISLQAWAILSNHYHVVLQSPSKPANIGKIVRTLHGATSSIFNKIDGTQGRKVWFQYWDTKITFENSYYTRIKYVTYNPIHHKIISNASEYRWCSAAWFESKANAPFLKRILEMKTDQLKVMDDF